jgi:hypothetical protein
MEPDDSIAPLVVLGAFAFVCLLGTVFGLLDVPRALKRRDVVEENRRRLALWDTLYYCQRDDVVYVPGSPQRCRPASEMAQLSTRPDAA